jgi:steroid delta-isomerase-like uncharacterized protein
MSDANKLLAKQWFEEVWNQKSEAAIDRLFHAQGKAYGFPDATSAIGPDSFKALHRSFCLAFPDLHMEVEDIIAEGDRVAIRWKSSMTHLGDDLGFPATGKAGVVTGSSFLVINGSQIIEGWNQMDLQAFFLQLQAK